MKSKKQTSKKDQTDESFVSPKLSHVERLKVNQEFAEARRRAESKTSDKE